MTDAELDQHRSSLLARLVELDGEDQRGQDARKTVELDQQAIGRLSRMDALQNQAMAKAQATRRSAQRVRINAALTRIETSEFGYCTDCGESLEPSRLAADPSIPKCLSCTRG